MAELPCLQLSQMHVLRTGRLLKHYVQQSNYLNVYTITMQDQMIKKRILQQENHTAVFSFKKRKKYGKNGTVGSSA